MNFLLVHLAAFTRWIQLARFVFISLSLHAALLLVAIYLLSFGTDRQAAEGADPQSHSATRVQFTIREPTLEVSDALSIDPPDNQSTSEEEFSVEPKIAAKSNVAAQRQMEAELKAAGSYGAWMPQSLWSQGTKQALASAKATDASAAFDLPINAAFEQEVALASVLQKVAGILEDQLLISDDARKMFGFVGAAFDLEVTAEGGLHFVGISGDRYLRSFIYEKLKIISSGSYLRNLLREYQGQRFSIALRLEDFVVYEDRLNSAVYGAKVIGSMITLRYKGKPLQDVTDELNRYSKKFKLGPAELEISLWGIGVGADVGDARIQSWAGPGGLMMTADPDGARLRKVKQFEAGQRKASILSSPAFDSK